MPQQPPSTAASSATSPSSDTSARGAPEQERKKRKSEAATDDNNDTNQVQAVDFDRTDRIKANMKSCPFASCKQMRARQRDLTGHVETTHHTEAGPFLCAGCSESFDTFDSFWNVHLNSGFRKERTTGADHGCCRRAWALFFSVSTRARQQRVEQPRINVPRRDADLTAAYALLEQRLRDSNVTPHEAAAHALKQADSFLRATVPQNLMAAFLYARSDQNFGFPLLGLFVGRAFLGESIPMVGVSSYAVLANRVVQLWAVEATRTQWLARGCALARDLQATDPRIRALANVVNQQRRALRSFVFTALRTFSRSDEHLSLALEWIVLLCFPLDMFNALYAFNEHYIAQEDLPRCRVFMPEGDKFFIDEHFGRIVEALVQTNKGTVAKLGRLLITPRMWLPLHDIYAQSTERFLHEAVENDNGDTSWVPVSQTLVEFDESNPHCQRRG